MMLMFFVGGELLLFSFLLTALRYVLFICFDVVSYVSDKLFVGFCLIVPYVAVNLSFRHQPHNGCDRYSALPC